ncbi:MAG: hypothetical protein LBS52_02055 [Dysgonamonadaceae bacterium]|jgi:hypothetical protein|nr:hypothetical protein [Dysgonamonadaceae bacterium]
MNEKNEKKAYSKPSFEEFAVKHNSMFAIDFGSGGSGEAKLFGPGEEYPSMTT